MKKVLFALALGTTLVLTSCGGDDDNGPATYCKSCTNTSLNQTTEYCHTEGTTTYTRSVAGSNPETLQFADGQDWASLVAELNADPTCE